jgi:hypothetical protein
MRLNNTAAAAIISATLDMHRRLRDECERAVRAWRTLDRQTVFVLTACAALALFQYTLGTTSFFNSYIAAMVAPEQQAGARWAWMFVTQGVTGFVLPALSLLLLFRQRPAAIGLGLGDWRLAMTLAGLYLPLVVVGTWILSDGRDFQALYPLYRESALNWTSLLVYECLFLVYWLGWEYLWRGFVLFGTARVFGYWAIFVQMIPFALLHAGKPAPEAFMSIVGGVVIGAVCWRCRSFWIAVPIHAAQMMALDVWCTLRIRTGAQGIGLDALIKMIGGS